MAVERSMLVTALELRQICNPIQIWTNEGACVCVVTLIRIDSENGEEVARDRAQSK
jgi:hypothetical protein